MFVGVLDEASSEVERRSEPQMVAWKAQQAKANREEIEELRARGRELGVAGLRDKRREGQTLLARLRLAMQAAQNPGAAEVVELGERWRDFTAECRTHGMGSGAANAAMLASEPGLAEATARRLGIDVELLGYIGRVFDHLDWGTAEDDDA